eukprot:10941951-Lingulodinium_polyedra.AAC.1
MPVRGRHPNMFSRAWAARQGAADKRARPRKVLARRLMRPISPVSGPWRVCQVWGSVVWTPCQ